MRDERGFSLVEMIVSLTIMLFAMAGLSSLLVQNSKINKAQQMTADAQSNARNCLSLIVQRLRSAGWDPRNDNNFDPVVLDTDLADNISEIEVFADLEPVPDGFTNALDEQVLIRHVGNRVEWRRSPASAFIILANNISNDANGDGTPEPMFTPDANPPTMITVTITAQSPVPDPTTGQFIRYTVSSDVVLRKSL